MASAGYDIFVFVCLRFGINGRTNRSNVRMPLAIVALPEVMRITL